MQALTNVGTFGEQTSARNDLGFGYVRFDDSEGRLIFPYWTVFAGLGLASGSLIIR